MASHSSRARSPHVGVREIVPHFQKTSSRYTGCEAVHRRGLRVPVLCINVAAWRRNDPVQSELSPTSVWSDSMSRLVSFGLLTLVVGSVSSMGYAQCGGHGYFNGGYPATSRGYGHQVPVYSSRYPQQRYYYPQPQYYYTPSPSYAAPQYQSGGYYGGRATYSAPQGAGVRGCDSRPIYQPQPTYQPAPSYSAPQGSGVRSYPSQGSGSR